MARRRETQGTKRVVMGNDYYLVSRQIGRCESPHGVRPGKLSIAISFLHISPRSDGSGIPHPSAPQPLLFVATLALSVGAATMLHTSEFQPLNIKRHDILMACPISQHLQTLPMAWSGKTKALRSYKASTWPLHEMQNATSGLL